MIPVIFVENVGDVYDGTVCVLRVLLRLLLCHFANIRLIVVLRLSSFDSRLTALPHVLLDILVQVEQVLLDLELLADLQRELHILLDLQLLLLLLDEFLKLARSPFRLRTLLA